MAKDSKNFKISEFSCHCRRYETSWECLSGLILAVGVRKIMLRLEELKGASMC